ncbi:uncharacterized protein N7515_000305 [Penicillium bovifimosum]|uniref:NTF2 domain-containing protein n=1 Tax=Penicillium bovifimosum TaxID=126998 RepID=A0A9W9HF97_9EURO|nr:uncharacterized protein N7515_000305 [Penicillium bovifimosum]KAJ5145741.1 hypothetical protein N7515_000305 [Penicillium bovifimosum]
MADMTQVPVNGNYPAQHGYPESYNHAAATMNNAASFQPAQTSTPTTSTPTDQQKHEISKDEVGWYFVEQYYTTMSRTPEKLHLFYSRRSQHVFGTEAESVPVTVGTKAINEKLNSLKFQDCKVRVLNVDSQASFDNILVSVIGEISNNSEPSRKFVQTFVLAEQPNGYYVLNDIFRYMAEEPEEETEQPTPAPVAEAPEAAVAVPAQEEEAQVVGEAAVSKVDEKLEEVEANGHVEEQPKEVVPETNGAPAEEAPAPVPAVPAEVVTAEKPATPEPSPAPEKAEIAEKEAAPAPAAPKTWANIATTSFAAKAAAAAKAAGAQAAPASAPAAAAPKAAVPAAQPAAAPAAHAEAARSPETPSAEAGWQTAGPDHKKSQSRAGEETVLAYIKNVNEKVDASLLKQTLARFGKLKYFDVSRPKNCAFVEFNEPSGYAAAVAANPHQIGSEQILVEERRPRGNAYGSNGFPAGRGGGAGRGRGDRTGSQGRGGFQREGRGSFTPRGRGGNVAAKGRTQAQAA